MAAASSATRAAWRRHVLSAEQGGETASLEERVAVLEKRVAELEERVKRIQRVVDELYVLLRVLV